MQQVDFAEGYFDTVSVGTKATTVRWNENIAPGAARFVFGARSLRGRVESVTSHAAATLTAEQADAPPGTDMREFVEALRRNYYAEMPDDAVVEVVRFVVERDDENSG